MSFFVENERNVASFRYVPLCYNTVERLNINVITGGMKHDDGCTTPHSSDDGES